MFVIDHAEQGRAEPPEPAPVEGADYEQDQGKFWCFKPQSLNLFNPSFTLFVILGCALGYRS
jgi:hypothetical protein